jgi:predicted metalloprotease
VHKLCRAMLALVFGIAAGVSAFLPADTSAAELRDQSDVSAGQLQDFADLVLRDVNGYWASEYSDYSSDVSVIVIGEGYFAQTACGPAGDPLEDSSFSPAFYCSAGGETAGGSTDSPVIYFSAPWILSEAGKVAPSNHDFAIATIIAHEVGHHLQHQMGLFDEHGYPNHGLVVRDTELHADCLAGSWARKTYYADQMEDTDLEEAMTIVVNAGSDTPLPPGDPGDHGTRTDRLTAWENGFHGVVDGHCEDTYL